MNNVIHNTMRKLVFTLLMLLTLSLSAQERDVVKFMGIPVDGTKSEMISQIKKKGFVYNSEDDYLQGRFNGKDVNVYIHTEKGLVDRIMVAYRNDYDEVSIKYEFNSLLSQFLHNERYSLRDTCNYIGENERISIHKKRYQVGFYQTYSSQEKEELLRKINNNFDYYVELIKEYMPDYKDLFSNYEYKDFTEKSILAMLETKYEIGNLVWFTICATVYDEYYICIYYDNLYNTANGEDL